jgi:hypothetical protein
MWFKTVVLPPHETARTNGDGATRRESPINGQSVAEPERRIGRFPSGFR